MFPYMRILFSLVPPIFDFQSPRSFSILHTPATFALSSQSIAHLMELIKTLFSLTARASSQLFLPQLIRQHFAT